MIDVGGEPKVADFRISRILTPKKGDTSQDPKTRVRNLEKLQILDLGPIFRNWRK